MRRSSFSSKFNFANLESLDKVQDVLELDINKLLSQFCYGYHLRSASIYVALTNNEGDKRKVTYAIVESWNEH